MVMVTYFSLLSLAPPRSSPGKVRCEAPLARPSKRSWRLFQTGVSNYHVHVHLLCPSYSNHPRRISKVWPYWIIQLFEYIKLIQKLYIADIWEEMRSKGCVAEVWGRTDPHEPTPRQSVSKRKLLWFYNFYKKFKHAWQDWNAAGCH